MIIFSERLNGMYRDVRAAIPDRNKQVIHDLLRSRLEGGPDAIDLNIGPSKGDPVENFVWLARTAHEITDKPLSLDSAKADLLVEVVPRVRQALPDTGLVINSCTAAPQYMEKLIPVAVANRTGIIGLTMDRDGVPGNVEKRIECGAIFLMAALEAGIAIDDVYLDLTRYRDAVGIRVERIMNRDVIVIHHHESCRRAVEVFLRMRVGSLPVVDDDGLLVGILSESDLMLPANTEKNVSDILTRDVLTVEEHCTVAKVIRMFQSKRIRSIPVVDAAKRVVGIVGRRDVLVYYAQHWESARPRERR